MSSLDGHGEVGFTLVEVVLAAAISLAVLLMVSLAATTTVGASVHSTQEGTSTDSAMIAAQEVQELLAGAWTPGSPTTVDSQCTGGSNGQAFVAGNGPFVGTPTATDIWLCAFRVGASMPYTYELHFTNCDSSGLCTLQADQQGAPGCDPCVATTVFATSGVLGSGTPFAFSTASGSTWTITTTPSQIQGIEVTLVVRGRGGSGTTVQRTVLLPNTLAGAS